MKDILQHCYSTRAAHWRHFRNGFSSITLIRPCLFAYLFLVKCTRLSQPRKYQRMYTEQLKLITQCLMLTNSREWVKEYGLTSHSTR